MRFGMPLFGTWKNPDEWLGLLRAKGCNAAYCPVGLDASDVEVTEYASAARQHDIVIAEVGAWLNNPLHPDRDVAEKGFAGIVKSMVLAEKIGARCCVNVCGSRGEVWDGPHRLNLTAETFGRIVAFVNRLLDEVKPASTSFTLEMMPWMFPTTAQEMLDLIHAVGRPGFAAHVDLVNITCSPRLYFENAGMTQECFRLLGGMVRSVHLKDILLAEQLTVHLDEVRPGLGGFDHGALLSSVAATCPDAPVLLEHLPDEREYDLAAAHVRGIARSLGIAMPGAEVSV